MKQGPDQDVGLRNERKPCHFWVDNEVADCYQAIVGADAIWVYCRIARYANGAWIVSPKLRGTADSRIGLREMAGWCGKSTDTVWRCLEVLQLVGLLRAERGAKSKGRYAMTDVKDLVTREGGTYDREIGSFQLPPARAAALKEQVRELRRKMARKKALKLLVMGEIRVGESADGKEEASEDARRVENASVAQSDSFGGDLFAADVSKCDSTVAPDVQICRSGATDARVILGNLKEARNTTPQPPQAGECALGDSTPALALELEVSFTAEQLAHLAKRDDPKWRAEWEEYYRAENAEIARKQSSQAQAEREAAAERERLQAELISVPAAAQWVMRRCGFVASRRRRGAVPAIQTALEEVLQHQLDQGEQLWKTAPAMALAWESYRRNGENLRVQYGPVKFFELAVWLDSRGWAWKPEKRRG